jgi:hypothetical protein
VTNNQRTLLTSNFFFKTCTAVYFFLSVLVFNGEVQAQLDPHFTLNYMVPMAINPALTGSMDGSYRVTSIYRNQWANITNPFSTIGFSAELTTSKNISIGTSFFRQTAAIVDTGIVWVMFLYLMVA